MENRSYLRRLLFLYSNAEREDDTMKEFVTWMQCAFAAIGGFMGWFFGGFDGFLYALLVFVIIDYLTGVMLGIIQKKLSSEVGFKGIFKKVLIFCLVAIGNIIDTHLLKQGSIIRTAVIFFYLSNEGISILENTALIGLPVPQKLKDILEQLKDKKEE